MTTIKNISSIDLADNMYEALMGLTPQDIVNALCDCYGRGYVLNRVFAEFLVDDGYLAPEDLGVEDDYLDEEDEDFQDDTDDVM